MLVAESQRHNPPYICMPARSACVAAAAAVEEGCCCEAKRRGAAAAADGALMRVMVAMVWMMMCTRSHRGRGGGTAGVVVFRYGTSAALCEKKCGGEELPTGHTRARGVTLGGHRKSEGGCSEFQTKLLFSFSHIRWVSDDCLAGDHQAGVREELGLLGCYGNFITE
jgi:hypothetical protein